MIDARLVKLGLFFCFPLTAWSATLPFEQSPYGLLFVDITVNGKPVTAMVDFGDPYTIQLATSLIEAEGIPVAPTGQQAMYADGTSFDLMEGQVDRVEIADSVLEEVVFGSAPGEIDAVAEQVGTPFQAVIGWGFFGPRRFLLDYSNHRFELGLDACPSDRLATVSRVSGSSYLMIEGTLGDEPVRFLVDTGNATNVVHSGIFEQGQWPGDDVQIEHLTGEVAGRSISIGLADSTTSAEFELRDLSMLEPLGVQAILGGTFLSSVRLCHDPEKNLIHVLENA